MRKRRRQRGQHFEGLADFLLSSGHFNTADLTEIGRAFDDTFVALGITREDVVDVLDYLPEYKPTEAEFDKEIEEVTRSWEQEKDTPLDDLTAEWIDSVDLGAKLVRELADRGFRIVRER